MHETLSLLMAWMAGAVLGAFFFGGLWWTIRKGILSDRPALWFFGSFLLRMTVVMAGFYLIACDNRWQRIVICLVGFIMSRLIVTWLTRARGQDSPLPSKEARHAP